MNNPFVRIDKISHVDKKNLDTICIFLKSYRNNNNTDRVAFSMDNGRLYTILDSYYGALADLY